MKRKKKFYTAVGVASTAVFIIKFEMKGAYGLTFTILNRKVMAVSEICCPYYCTNDGYNKNQKKEIVPFSGSFFSCEVVITKKYEKGIYLDMMCPGRLL